LSDGKFAPNAEVYGPEYYERMYRPHWFLRNRRKYEEREAALLRIVRPGPATRVLEVGSARGDTAFFLAPRVHSVVGIDAAPVAVAAARARLAALDLENVRFEESDARDLSRVSGGPFDVVLLADFVEHVLDDVLLPCLASARNVLRPGGVLAIYTPNAAHWAERIKAATRRRSRASSRRTISRSGRRSASSISWNRRGSAWRTSSSPRARIPSSAPSTARSRWSASAVSGRACGR
jgi:SAM-dependent methyltransferase